MIKIYTTLVVILAITHFSYAQNTFPASGNVGIGITTPSSQLELVFKPTYTLPSLTEVKTYINKNQHLPEMPSEQEVVKNGINLGDMTKLQTKKIEELTLYLIEKDKQVNEQQNELKEQQVKSEKQEARLATLEAAILKLTAVK